MEKNEAFRPEKEEVTYVTSFSDDLWEVSAKRLVDSFVNRRVEGKLVICKEGNAPRIEHPQITYYDLDEDEFLHDWLKANKAVIPDYLGGTATACECENREERHADHVSGCHWQWMNRNASRWFRKVASLRIAQKYAGRYMVWVDADVVFKKTLPVFVLQKTLDGCGMCYCQGHRIAVESGVLLFDLVAGGSEIIDELCRVYTSGEYLQYKRWDDGYQIGLLVDRFEDVPTKDLVRKISTNRKTVDNDVIPKTILRTYFAHDKGRHGRKLDVML